MRSIAFPVSLAVLLSSATASAEPVEKCADPETSIAPLSAVANTTMCGDRPFVAKDTPLSEPVAGLSAMGNVPLPSRSPDADGWFHPAPGYTEGGTFGAPVEKAEWAVPASEIAAGAQAGSLRIAEWNIARGAKLDKAIKAMKKINADVWIINESDLYGKSGGGKVVAREIAQALGFSYYTGVEFNERLDSRRGSSGNAIVSRYPIRQGAASPIPMFKRELGGYDWAYSLTEPRCGQRGALSGRIDVPSSAGGTTSINVVSLHTENKTVDRKLGRVDDAVKKTFGGVRQLQFEFVRDSMTVAGEPTVMAGDLNTITWGEGPRFRGYLDRVWRERGPEAAMFDCSRGANTDTFDLKIINKRIDWMMVQPGANGALTCPQGSYRVYSHDNASDHKPVVTDFLVR